MRLGEMMDSLPFPVPLTPSHAAPCKARQRGNFEREMLDEHFPKGQE
jgi:hypothetical protein